MCGCVVFQWSATVSGDGVCLFLLRRPVGSRTASLLGSYCVSPNTVVDPVLLCGVHSVNVQFTGGEVLRSHAVAGILAAMGSNAGLVTP